MATVAILYVVLSLALGSAWIATEFRFLPRRALAVEFLVAALAWPVVLAFVVTLLLATTSRRHDG